ncbi:S8 family peptidase [Microbulbifer sp. SSSA002]|uniref:S8 family peptidase n=1 Tax=unclassified Microbulbifer TaxID=2619833 RepID=UPI004038FE7E
MKFSLKVLLQKTALASAFSLLCATPFSTYAEEAGSARLTDRIIVKYKEGAKVGQASVMAEETVAKASRQAGHKMHHLRRIATGAQVMRLEERKNRAELNEIIDRLNQDPDVEYAELDRIMQPMAVPNDPSYLDQWHYYESTGGLNLPTAWDTTQGSGAVVAVIDTGYRPHVDLVGNILPGYDMIDDTFVSVDGDGRDSDATDPGDWYSAGTCGGTSARNSSWHGTHVSGTVAGITNNNIGIAGVAYEAKIVPVRVLGRCGGYLSDVADGVIWGAGGSVSGIPNNANPAHVLNMSLGGGGSCGTTMQTAVDTARSLGATVVVSAGNSNADASLFTPASCNGVITVAATNRSGGRTYYSNYGSVVDVAAPGGEQSFAGDPNGVLSTYNAGATDPTTDSYNFIQGTSMSAPHVAGAAALLYSIDPSLTPDDVELILTSTARSFPATCNSCGSGIVDAAAAVAAVGGGGGGDDDLEETNLSGSRNDWHHFAINVDSGASILSAMSEDGTGDADLYVRFGQQPTRTAYDCRPYLWGNDESCTINNPAAGTWYISIRGYSAYSGVTLRANSQ